MAKERNDEKLLQVWEDYLDDSVPNRLTHTITEESIIVKKENLSDDDLLIIPSLGRNESSNVKENCDQNLLEISEIVKEEYILLPDQFQDVAVFNEKAVNKPVARKQNHVDIANITVINNNEDSLKASDSNVVSFQNNIQSPLFEFPDLVGSFKKDIHYKNEDGCKDPSSPRVFKLNDSHVENKIRSSLRTKKRQINWNDLLRGNRKREKKKSLTPNISELIAGNGIENKIQNKENGIQQQLNDTLNGADSNNLYYKRSKRKSRYIRKISTQDKCIKGKPNIALGRRKRRCHYQPLKLLLQEVGRNIEAQLSELRALEISLEKEGKLCRTDSQTSNKNLNDTFEVKVEPKDQRRCLAKVNTREQIRLKNQTKYLRLRNLQKEIENQLRLLYLKQNSDQVKENLNSVIFISGDELTLRYEVLKHSAGQSKGPCKLKEHEVQNFPETETRSSILPIQAELSVQTNEVPACERKSNNSKQVHKLVQSQYNQREENFSDTALICSESNQFPLPQDQNEFSDFLEAEKKDIFYPNKKGCKDILSPIIHNPNELSSYKRKNSLVENKIRSSLRTRKNQINWNDYLRGNRRKTEKSKILRDINILKDSSNLSKFCNLMVATKKDKSDDNQGRCKGSESVEDLKPDESEFSELLEEVRGSCSISNNVSGKGVSRPNALIKKDPSLENKIRSSLRAKKCQINWSDFLRGTRKKTAKSCEDLSSTFKSNESLIERKIQPLSDIDTPSDDNCKQKMKKHFRCKKFMPSQHAERGTDKTAENITDDFNKIDKEFESNLKNSLIDGKIRSSLRTKKRRINWGEYLRNRRKKTKNVSLLFQYSAETTFPNNLEHKIQEQCNQFSDANNFQAQKTYSHKEKNRKKERWTSIKSAKKDKIKTVEQTENDNKIGKQTADSNTIYNQKQEQPINEYMPSLSKINQNAVKMKPRKVISENKNQLVFKDMATDDLFQNKTEVKEENYNEKKNVQDKQHRDQSKRSYLSRSQKSFEVDGAIQTHSQIGNEKALNRITTVDSSQLSENCFNSDPQTSEAKFVSQNNNKSTFRGEKARKKISTEAHREKLFSHNGSKIDFPIHQEETETQVLNQQSHTLFSNQKRNFGISDRDFSKKKYKKAKAELKNLQKYCKQPVQLPKINIKEEKIDKRIFEQHKLQLANKHSQSVTKANYCDDFITPETNYEMSVSEVSGPNQDLSGTLLCFKKHENERNNYFEYEEHEKISRPGTLRTDIRQKEVETVARAEDYEVQSILRTAQQTVFRQSEQNLKIVQVIKVKYQ